MTLNSPHSSLWQEVLVDGVPGLHRRVKCSGFQAVCQLIEALNKLAEQHDHHPDICYGYDYCQIRWTTHSQGGISESDHKMAALSDACIKECGQ